MQNIFIFYMLIYLTQYTLVFIYNIYYISILYIIKPEESSFVVYLHMTSGLFTLHWVGVCLWESL